jgi:hypothetical protein
MKNAICLNKDMSGLIECQSITNLDLQSNHIEYDEEILPLLMKMSNILCIYLKSNALGRMLYSYMNSQILPPIS